MPKVAKLIIIDSQEKYLLLYRSAHPFFGDDPDLPGGTLEKGEIPLDTMVREVYEEIGFHINGNDATLVYQGTKYSLIPGAELSLYELRVAVRPEPVLSWEHKSYEWLSRDEFIQKSLHANDTYMHMVSAVLR